MLEPPAVPGLEEQTCQDMPSGAVEEATRQFPAVPTVRAVQPVEEATSKLPVDVACWAIRLSCCGKLNVQVGEELVMVRAVTPNEVEVAKVEVLVKLTVPGEEVAMLKAFEPLNV